VEAALELLLAQGAPITCDALKALERGAARVEVPALSLATVDLGEYNGLLEEVGT
jgi:hypothetical protein